MRAPISSAATASSTTRPSRRSRCAMPASSASRCSTSTTTTATARRRSSTNAPTCSSPSLHGDPHTEYPYYLGYADERGAGAGLGFNHNLPLARGSGFARVARGAGDGAARHRRIQAGRAGGLARARHLRGRSDRRLHARHSRLPARRRRPRPRRPADRVRLRGRLRRGRGRRQRGQRARRLHAASPADARGGDATRGHTRLPPEWPCGPMPPFESVAELPHVSSFPPVRRAARRRRHRRPRADLPDPADQAGDRLPGRRPDRHHDAAAGRQRVQDPRPADRGRQQARRRRHAAGAGAADRAARRLHHRPDSARRVPPALHDQDQLGPGQGHQLRHQRHRLRLRHRGAGRQPVQDLERFRRLRQGQSRQAHLRLDRQSHQSAPDDRTASPSSSASSCSTCPTKAAPTWRRRCSATT